MNEDSTVVRFPQPDAIDDPLTTVLRSGARRLLAQAIEAEAEAFLAGMTEQRLADGRARFVRHGHGPERAVQTGIGPVGVQRVKIRVDSTPNGSWACIDAVGLTTSASKTIWATSSDSSSVYGGNSRSAESEKKPWYSLW